jgi:hypothetical protein
MSAHTVKSFASLFQSIIAEAQRLGLRGSPTISIEMTGQLREGGSRQVQWHYYDYPTEVKGQDIFEILAEVARREGRKAREEPLMLSDFSDASEEKDF